LFLSFSDASPLPRGGSGGGGSCGSGIQNMKQVACCCLVCLFVCLFVCWFVCLFVS